jgi:hypothetical protein
MTDLPISKTNPWRFILARAKEASTWRGLALLAGAAGASLSPALNEAIIAAGIAIAGLIGVLVPDAQVGE